MGRLKMRQVYNPASVEKTAPAVSTLYLLEYSRYSATLTMKMCQQESCQDCGTLARSWSVVDQQTFANICCEVRNAVATGIVSSYIAKM